MVGNSVGDVVGFRVGDSVGFVGDDVEFLVGLSVGDFAGKLWGREEEKGLEMELEYYNIKVNNKNSKQLPCNYNMKVNNCKYKRISAED